jgi:hypothetical protein
MAEGTALVRVRLDAVEGEGRVDVIRPPS